MGQTYTTDDLKSHLWEYYNTNNELPSIKDINNIDDYACRKTYYKYFNVDSWIEVLEYVDFDEHKIEKYKFKSGATKITKEKLLNQLKRYKEEFDKVPTGKDMTRAEYYSSANTFYDYFPNLSWDEIVQKADLEKPKRELTKQDVLDEIHRVIDELGEIPTRNTFDKNSKYAASTIAKHFDNSYLKALKETGYNPDKRKTSKSGPKNPHGSPIASKDLINELQRLHDELDKIPSTIDVKENGLYSKNTYYTHFNSFTDALIKAGFDPSERNQNIYSKQEVISELERVCNLLGHSPSQKEFTQHSNISYKVLYKHFGSLCDALIELGYEPNRYTNVSKEELISDFHNLKKKLDRFPRYKDIEKHGKYSRHFYDKNFNNMEEIIKASDLNKNDKDYNLVTNDELIKELKRLSNEIGKTPTQKEIKNMGKYGNTTYFERFGSLANACLKADLKPNNCIGLSNEQLLDELKRVSNMIDGTPTTRDMQQKSFCTKDIFKTRFGSMMNAREEAGLPRKNKTTWIERWAYNTLNKMNIQFKKEVSIGSYRVDVMIEEEKNKIKYVLELDGDYYHKETLNNRPAAGDLDYQRKRDEYITNQGFHVIRILESDIENNENKIKEKLDSILNGELEPPNSGKYINP